MNCYVIKLVLGVSTPECKFVQLNNDDMNFNNGLCVSIITSWIQAYPVNRSL